MIPKADSISGFIPHQDSISCEKRLAATVISTAWKDALAGDKGAFDFALSPDSLFQFWCRVCGLDLEAARSCFEHLKDGKYPEIPIPPSVHSLLPTHLCVLDVSRAVRLFTLLRPFARNRPEVFTWIALDMEKSYKTIKNMFFVMVKKATSESEWGGGEGEGKGNGKGWRRNGHNEALVGLENGFWEVWNGG